MTHYYDLGLSVFLRFNELAGKSAVIILLCWGYGLFWGLSPFFVGNRYIPEGILNSCSFDYLTRDEKASYILQARLESTAWMTNHTNIDSSRPSHFHWSSSLVHTVSRWQQSSSPTLISSAPFSNTRKRCVNRPLKWTLLHCEATRTSTRRVPNSVSQGSHWWTLRCGSVCGLPTPALCCRELSEINPPSHHWSLSCRRCSLRPLPSSILSSLLFLIQNRDRSSKAFQLPSIRRSRTVQY